MDNYFIGRIKLESVKDECAMSELQKFREAKDDFFATHPQSPIAAVQQKDFQGLTYFPERKDLQFEVEVDEFEEKVEIQMQTSTGDVQTYVRYGRFKFTVDDQEAELTIFASEDHYFLPFVDSQAGGETYGAGRYLDPEKLPDGRILVDFNLAYNPYCAYNDRWSCPIPPSENRLSVPIQAGERNFKIQ